MAHGQLELTHCIDFTQIAGSILFGAGSSGVHVSLKMHSERGPSDEPISSAEHWSVFTDSTLAPQAEKLVLHLARCDLGQVMGNCHEFIISLLFYLSSPTLGNTLLRRACFTAI